MTTRGTEEGCPLAEMDDRYQEAHYFIEQMMDRYHEPSPFRWSLNAFIQALRNVTFMLQSALAKTDGFEAWYAGQQAWMKGDPLLRAFVEGRNIVAKQRNLELRSRASIGLFRGGKPKLVLQGEVEIPSVNLMANYAKVMGSGDPDNGEELGVHRTWESADLGDGPILKLCDAAWSRIGKVRLEAHRFIGRECFVPPEHAHDPEMVAFLAATGSPSGGSAER